MGTRTNKPRMCWYVDATFYVEGLGFRPSVVTENEPGHSPNGTWPYNGKKGERMPYRAASLVEAEELCARLNTRLGLSKDDVFNIVNSSMLSKTASRQIAEMRKRGSRRSHSRSGQVRCDICAPLRCSRA